MMLAGCQLVEWTLWPVQHLLLSHLGTATVGPHWVIYTFRGLCACVPVAHDTQQVHLALTHLVLAEYLVKMQGRYYHWSKIFFLFKVQERIIEQNKETKLLLHTVLQKNRGIEAERHWWNFTCERCHDVSYVESFESNENLMEKKRSFQTLPVKENITDAFVYKQFHVSTIEVTCRRLEYSFV